MFVEVLTVGPYKLKEFVNVCVELLTVGPYTFVNFAKSPFKTPAWKAPTFPPSGGDTSVQLTLWVWPIVTQSQSC